MLLLQSELNICPVSSVTCDSSKYPFTCWGNRVHIWHMKRDLPVLVDRGKKGKGSLQPTVLAHVYLFTCKTCAQKCLKGHLILLASLLHPLALVETLLPALIVKNRSLKSYLITSDLIHILLIWYPMSWNCPVLSISINHLPSFSPATFHGRSHLTDLPPFIHLLSQRSANCKGPHSKYYMLSKLYSFYGSGSALPLW